MSGPYRQQGARAEIIYSAAIVNFSQLKNLGPGCKLKVKNSQRMWFGDWAAILPENLSRISLSLALDGRPETVGQRWNNVDRQRPKNQPEACVAAACGSMESSWAVQPGWWLHREGKHLEKKRILYVSFIKYSAKKGEATKYVLVIGNPGHLHQIFLYLGH